ncbi:uncharacterized protein LOC111311045 isoform X2 [Durio zibethinus]|uniref:Uncharacterized protein LOC111311045 isoform X2 n=1 Tax=Durio zibethinus TaxID=66656 RepID=A0A6P6AMQ6_DURZI|nr:uncharacterized protein LOC111311045 isoform X2 [Durio zibethinus]
MELIIIKFRPIPSILLLLLLLSIPYFSTGSLDVSDEVYEIDYRGPETHSSIPPPDHSHGHRHWIHRETDLPTSKTSKGLRGGNNKGRNVKKIHG